jgi:SagB-type dehydrogenase family enzyme
MTQPPDPRRVLKSDFSAANFQSDQQKGVEVPPPVKPAEPGQDVFDLPAPDDVQPVETNLLSCLASRRSRRKYKPEPVTIQQLSVLLWATQGVKRILGDGQVVFKTVPSAGARHPLETYLAVKNIRGLEPGIYRYLGDSHKLVGMQDLADPGPALREAGMGQDCLAAAAVTFCWAAIPYRTEWRYHTLAHKPILLDTGHVCQNLYLACEALGLGTVAVAAYDQQKIDELLGLDGMEEFVIYLAPVGVV